MRRARWMAGVLAAAMTLTAALSGCSGSKENVDPNKESTSATGEPVDGGSVTVGIAQDLDSLDPFLALGAGTEGVLFNVYEGLVKPDPDGNLIPAVAKDYTVAEDGSALTFVLRENVKFHNGAAVTMEDVVYSVEKAAGWYEADKTPLVNAYANVEAVEVQEDGTLLVTLKEADTEFITNMTQAIVPKNYDKLTTEPVGCGPFRFESRNEGDKIVFARFEEYWGEKAYLEEVVFKVCSDSDAVVTNLNGGSIDIYPNMTASMASSLNKDFYVLEGTMNLVQALYLNHDAKPFDDIQVRQALCYGINEQEILDLVSDGKGAIIGSSMFPSFGKYYMPELADLYPQDVEKAKQLLAEAGYPNGFEMSISVPSNYQPHIDTAQVVVEQLKAIGVTAKIQLITWEAWLDDVYNGRKFESTVIGLDASTLSAAALVARFESTSGKNFTNFDNKAFDEAFQAAKAASDDEEKTSYYKECLQILADEAANVYIQDMADFVAVRNGIAGYTFYPMYLNDMSKVYYTE